MGDIRENALRYFGLDCPAVAQLNMWHTDMPSMDAGAMPNPTIRRVKTSMTRITQWLRMRIDSTRNRSTHQMLSLAGAAFIVRGERSALMVVSQDGPVQRG